MLGAGFATGVIGFAGVVVATCFKAGLAGVVTAGLEVEEGADGTGTDGFGGVATDDLRVGGAALPWAIGFVGAGASLTWDAGLDEVDRGLGGATGFGFEAAGFAASGCGSPS